MGTDLKLEDRGLGSDLLVSSSGDLVIVSEETNLAQAIVNRLKTIEGELFEIGHLTYGSRLLDFIGELNNNITRNRIRNHIKSILLKEPRIKEIVKLTVKGVIIGDSYNNNNNTRLSNYHQNNIKNKNFSDNTLKMLDQLTFSEDSLAKQESAINDIYLSLNTVFVDITIIPIDQEVPLNLVFPFYLDIMTEVENLVNVQ
ncbi:MAG TPA: hypothetical protein VFV86_12530 [Nitrososphaeraceae archaeon]|nr:hypothetical protein [Nitrososphaeraceae archaeon]